MLGKVLLLSLDCFTYPWSIPYNVECLAGRHRVPFFWTLDYVNGPVDSLSLCTKSSSILYRVPFYIQNRVPFYIQNRVTFYIQIYTYIKYHFRYKYIQKSIILYKNIYKIKYHSIYKIEYHFIYKYIHISSTILGTNIYKKVSFYIKIYTKSSTILYTKSSNILYTNIYIYQVPF